MLYTTETLSQMQTILNVFQEYTSTSPYFDILFTPKRGYIMLHIERSVLEVEKIDTPEDLFRKLFFEITCDVRDLFLCGEHMTIDMYPAEIEESRKRILPYIKKLPEALQPYYTDLMEQYLRGYGGEN